MGSQAKKSTHTSERIGLVDNTESGPPGRGRDGAPPGIWSGRFAGGLIAVVLGWYVAEVLGISVYTGFSWPRVALASAVAGASGIVGGVAGFLFGIPRAGSGPPEARDARLFRPNTNLEQISDWLTKAIVGVGLIQIREIGGAVQEVGSRVGLAIGDLPAAPGSGIVVALSIIVGNVSAAFAVIYMWTSTRLYEVFQSSEKR
jgi:hypothetical protein